MGTTPRPKVAEANVSSKNPFFRLVPVIDNIEEEEGVVVLGSSLMPEAVCVAVAVAVARASASSSSWSLARDNADRREYSDGRATLW